MPPLRQPGPTRRSCLPSEPTCSAEQGVAEAASAYREAIERAGTEAERRQLERRLAELSELADRI